MHTWAQVTPLLDSYWSYYNVALKQKKWHGGFAQSSLPAAARRYVLVTPMVDDERGTAVLVNRGWVPAAWRTDAQLRARCQPSGRVRASAPLCAPHVRLPVAKRRLTASLCLKPLAGVQQHGL